jgi:hypothetical protein
MGCGNPPQDGHVWGNNTGVGESVVSSSTYDTARASSAAYESAREAHPIQLGHLGQATSQTLTTGDDDECRPDEPLVVPAWIAKDLASPDVPVRLQALDRWVRQGEIGSVDPLMLALTDSDERVQARALTLIEEDWARAQATED